MRGFIGQEATHQRIHSLFNEHLARQGLVDRWTPRAAARMTMMAGVDPRHAVAITAATEHFTAMFAEWLLAHPETLDGAEPRLKTLWLWHSAEELEHRDIGLAHEAEQAPAYQVLTGLIKAGSRAAIWAAQRF